jgi:hypothetical protein
MERIVHPHRPWLQTLCSGTKTMTQTVAETHRAVNVTLASQKIIIKREPAMSQSAAATQAIVDEKNAVYKRITLRLIPFIFICYLFNYLDRVNVGFPSCRCSTR